MAQSWTQADLDRLETLVAGLLGRTLTTQDLAPRPVCPGRATGTAGALLPAPWATGGPGAGADRRE